ncbi:MAG: hypothetical protein HY329_25480 [Chloroflexi bacterium]|nr:hypothetical protein [Chloroflexota bacterium]
MRVVVNEQYIQQKARIGKWGTLAGLILMIVPLLLIYLQDQQNPNLSLVALVYIAFTFGFIIMSIGSYHQVRWGRSPREDERIVQSLKGLSHEYRLMSYVAGLPSHVLLSPGGIFVIEPRYNSGKITIRGQDYRRRFSPFMIFGGSAEGRLGNPAGDAWRGAEQIKELLAQRLGMEVAAEVVVQPIVLFLMPKVTLDVADPAVPNLTPGEIKSWLRKNQAKRRLTPSEQQQARAALVGDLAPMM